MIRELIREILDLYNFWGGLMFSIQFLAFVAHLSSNYIPSGPNAIAFCFQLIFFMIINFVISAFEGVIISLILRPVYWFLDLLK